MDILNSLYTSVFGMVVVFAVLVLLILLINMQTALIKRFSNRKATADLPITVSSTPQQNHESAHSTKEVHFTAPAPQFLDLVDVDETTAAVIMAIICDQIGALPEELYFNSIRLITEPVPAKN